MAYARVVFRPGPVPSQPRSLPWRVDVDGNEVSGHATKAEALAALAALPPPEPPPEGPGLKHPLAAAVLLATTPPILEGGPDAEADDEARKSPPRGRR